MAKPISHRGRCHCGNLRVAFESAVPPAELFVRRCACSFCRRHGGVYVSDPAGGVRISVEDPAKLTRYRFGHKTADFLICGDCGVFVCVVMADDGARCAVVNVNTFEQTEGFVPKDAAFDYDAESETDRMARRRARWTPILSFTEGPG